MPPFGSLCDIFAHGVGDNTDTPAPEPDTAKREFSRFNQASDGTDRHPAKLTGNFFKRPEQHDCPPDRPTRTCVRKSAARLPLL